MLKLAIRDPNPLPPSPSASIVVKTYICSVRMEVFNTSMNHYGPREGGS